MDTSSSRDRSSLLCRTFFVAIFKLFFRFMQDFLKLSPKKKTAANEMIGSIEWIHLLPLRQRRSSKSVERPNCWWCTAVDAVTQRSLDIFLDSWSLAIILALRLKDEQVPWELGRGDLEFWMAVLVIIMLLGPARLPPLPVLETLCWRRIWRTELRNWGLEKP